jgi:Tfp pilus assembly protein PilW
MRKIKIKGMTLIEVTFTAAIFLIILIPVLTLFTKSTEMMFVGDQESSSQKEASVALYNIGQDIQKTLSFIDVNNTSLNSHFASWIYDNTGSSSTKIAYYWNSTNSTIRRVSNYTGSYSGGEVIAQNVSAFTCSFRTDTVYSSTLTPSQVAAVYVGITISIPGSTVSSLTSNSSWWSRNIRTL